MTSMETSVENGPQRRRCSCFLVILVLLLLPVGAGIYLHSSGFLRPTIEELLSQQFQKRGFALKLSMGAFEPTLSPLGFRAQDVKINNEINKPVFAAETINCSFALPRFLPDRLEIIRPEIHMSSYLRAVRSKEIKSAAKIKKKGRKNEGTIPQIPLPRIFLITDGRIYATSTITFTNLSTTLINSEKTVAIDPFGAICRIERKGVKPPPLIIGPIRGLIRVDEKGCGHLKLAGASAHFADEENSTIEVNLTICPNNSLEIKKIEGALPGGGKLSLAGSFAPLRSPPLIGRYQLIEIGADRIPVTSKLIGNITSGIAALEGTYEGDPFISPVDSEVQCKVSVKKPVFSFFRGEKETPVHLEELGGHLHFAKRKLKLKNLVIKGFGGSCDGSSTIDFSNFPSFHWQSAINIKDLSLLQLAQLHGVDYIKGGMARGRLELNGKGDSVAGKITMEKLSLRYEKEKENLHLRLSEGICEIDHKPPLYSRAFLRRGRLELTKDKINLVIPELSTRATSRQTGTEVDFLHCRVGKEGVLKIKDILIPSTLDKNAKLNLSCKKLDTALFSHLNLSKSIPRGILNASLFFRGIPKALQSSEVKAELEFEGLGEAALRSCEGRFSIKDGKITLAGARAKLLEGVGEGAGRGQFINGEPVGRFTFALRHASLRALFPDKSIPKRVNALLAINRKDSVSPAFLKVDVKGQGPVCCEIKGFGQLVNLMNWHHPLVGSRLTLQPSYVTFAENKKLSLPSGAEFDLHKDGLEIGLSSLQMATSTTGTVWTTAYAVNDLQALLNIDGVHIKESSLYWPEKLKKTIKVSGEVHKQNELFSFKKLSVQCDEAKAAIQGSYSPKATDVSFLSEPLSVQSVQNLMAVTVPLSWDSLRLKGRYKDEKMVIFAQMINGRHLSAPKMIISRGRVQLSLTDDVVTVQKAKLALPGGELTGFGYHPLPNKNGNWGFTVKMAFPGSDEIWQALGGRGPKPNSPIDLAVSGSGNRKTHIFEVKTAPVNLLLERKLSGRQLALGQINIHLTPRETGKRYNFKLQGGRVVYKGPELRKTNGLSTWTLAGTWRRGLLSLKESKLDFIDGGVLNITGEVPLIPGIDGEFTYKLQGLELQSWHPNYVVSLNGGQLSLSGTFLGAWGDIADSIIDLSVSLDNADIDAGGLKPGPFDLSAKVTYRKGALEMNEIQAKVLGGLLTGQGKGQWDRQKQLVDMTTQFKDLNLAQWVKVNTPPNQVAPKVEGLVTGELSIKNRGELRAGFIGNGHLNIVGGRIRNVATVVPERGKKYLRRFQDLIFSKAKSKLVLIGDTLKMRDVSLKANCGEMGGWLRLNRVDGKIRSRLYATLSKKLIPNRIAKSLASLFGGKYETVGLILHGPATLPEIDVLLSPGRRTKFLSGK